jgi:hypothetical protein
VDWTFVYLMVGLKLPIAALLWLVWWAVRAVPEPEVSDEGDGGSRRPRHPRPPRTPKPRRGSHADPPPVAPARTRSVAAIARDRDHASHP